MFSVFSFSASLIRIRQMLNAITRRDLRRLKIFQILGLDLSNFISLEESMKPKPLFRRLWKVSDGCWTIIAEGIFGEPGRRHWTAPRHVYEVPNASIGVNRGSVWVEGTLVQESSAWNSAWELVSSPSTKPKLRLEGSWIPLPNSTYYHFLIEDVPAVLHAMDHAPDAGLLLPKSSSKFVHEFATNSGRKLAFASESRGVERAIFTSRAGVLGLPQETDLHRLRREFLLPEEQDKVDCAGKLYISRRNSSRSFQYELNVENLLEREGFKVLYLENLSQAEQVVRFNRANVVIGPHGAGLANLAFSNPGTRVIELLDANWPNQCFEILAQKLELDFSRLIFNSQSRDSQADMLRNLLNSITDL